MSVLKNDNNTIEKNINSKSVYELPAVVRREKDEISFEKALIVSILLHPAVIIILLLASIVLRLLGIDFDMLKKCTKEISETEERLIKAFMPGPFTLILKKSDIIPNEVSANLDTVGIRMPSNKIAHTIISKSGVPVAAPSANVSGRPSGTNISDIKKELLDKVSIMIDGGDSDIGLESTVVKVIDNIPVILRPRKNFSRRY